MSGLSGARSALVRIGAHGIPSSSEMERAALKTKWPENDRGTSSSGNLWRMTKTEIDGYWIQTDKDEETEY